MGETNNACEGTDSQRYVNLIFLKRSGVLSICLVWDNLRPKLEELIKRNRQYLREEAIKKRRLKLRQLLKDKINSLKVSPELASAIGDGYSDHFCKAHYVPISALEDINCTAIDEFVKANEENEAYDNSTTLPDETWDKLAGNGLMVILDERRHFVEDVLNKLLIEGVTRVSNSALAEYDEKHVQPSVHSVHLPPTFSVHHAAAFFKVDSMYDPGSDYSTQRFSYSELVAKCGFHNRFYNTLVTGAKEWQSRAEEGGANAEAGKWSLWRPMRNCEYEGDQTAVQIALRLLEELGHEIGESTKQGSSGTEQRAEDVGGIQSTNNKVSVSMKTMEAKGVVFVCTRCPKEARVRRTWKNLVRIFGNCFRVGGGLILRLQFPIEPGGSLLRRSTSIRNNRDDVQVRFVRL